MLSRRLLLSTGAGLAACARLAAAVKPIRITAVDLYEVSLPVSQTEAEAGVMYRYQVAEVRTDAGVTGYSFAGHPPAALPHLRQLLVGRDLFAVEQLVHDGLYRWGGVEHALWDAIGKVARQPVYKLLGGSRTSVRAYLTCVWKGNPDQSQVPYREQAAMAARIQKAGFKGMKIRAWRPYPLDDAEACAVVKAAVGADFHLMFDRTAHAPEVVGQKVWPYEIGLKVARALQKNGAYWLEEPFARDDFESPARLAREVDILITGGEGYVGLDSFRQCLLHQTYDILQPEGRGSGGIFTVRKVATLAESFHVPVILHGTMGLMLAGWLNATLAIGAPWQEVALITPPLLPQEQWAPALKVLKTTEVFVIRNGELQAPEYPGLGLDLDEEALRRFRV
ncbi:MAG TPA: mandelate racemase/muconate lactonizing enzyme family protein [Bryobacteraceae bacterium]|nr:mandelate racemase/muconate lactonizing enzyme family protein [Bryobacteraceae bacterium]